MSVSHSTSPRAPRCLTFAVLAFVGLCGAAAESGDSAATANSGDDSPRLFAPTLGRPVFVEPGGTFQLVARVPDAVATVTFDLVPSGQSEPRHELEVGPAAARRLTASQAVRVTVPRAVPPRTYDLEVNWGGPRLLGRHCVAVGRVGRQLRLVHLSNMNIGDAGAPEFDWRLVDEVNLVGPTLIVATGDFLDVTHPDPAAGWRMLVEYLTHFEAPILIACGDHDDMELYSRYVAPSPVGLVNVGPHRGLVLADHPAASIDRDAEQIRWVERALGSPGFDGLTFVVTHDDSPNLLRYWQQQGTLARMIRAGRVGLWLAAGHCDWDGRAYRDLIHAAAPMAYLRTHQSSRAPRGGASGISHYRIVDIVDERVFLPGEATQSPENPPSTPVGYLSASLDGPNDGSRSQLSLSAVNNLPYRLNRLVRTLRLRKLAEHKPWCHGARLERAIDQGELWECRVQFDLPDKGALRALVGSGWEPPVPNLTVEFEVGRALRFHRSATPDGLTFLSLTTPPPVVHVRNQGGQPVELSPLVRLDGDPVAYQPRGGEARFATAYSFRLKPGEAVSLQLDLSAVRVARGRRELQVYLEGGDVVYPFCRTVDVILDG